MMMGEMWEEVGRSEMEKSERDWMAGKYCND